ncbi:hypothetical protein LHP98_00040 [Rhodobacter sp. Har01]|uniref:hypothetical protein n=1 Tax=Rhodobacter sp. Har01 TaxID=2883999 RepID=UPI001D08F03B|nr:hypothetical protein [Rhodobacter sp. Har01]MCB6176517.1 hypothetical protein [Rhodobacter sp. Har01]
MADIQSDEQVNSRLGQTAREIAARLGRVLRRSDRAEARRLRAAEADRPLAERLHVPIVEVSPESRYCAEIVQTHAALAQADRWAELLAEVRRADQARAGAPAGRRLAVLASDGARAALTAAIASRDWAAADEALDRLDAMQAVHHDDYAAAQILAQAHLDLGWARRGTACEAGPGGAGRQGFLSHTAEAERVLDQFDPIEENSPLLAGTRYRLVQGIDEGEALVRDWYQDWSDLDPTCPEPHAAHAVHLLPPWYGRPEGFEAEARAAVKRTSDVSGAAAYAVFYLSAAQAQGDYPPGMDLGLFVRGLIDHHRATGCQYRANIVAGALTELAHSQGYDTTLASMRAKVVMETLDDHVRDNLREFHLPAWENGLDCIHWAMGQLFHDDLLRGAHIYPGVAGLEARMP